MSEDAGIALADSFSCTPICHVVVTLEGLVAAIGPAGDIVYLPMRITGGIVRGIGFDKPIVCGTDFAAMYGDEKLVHNGNFVVSDPAGDILVWYDGASQAGEGAYDELLDGQLPRSIPCRLRLRSISTGPEWRRLNGRPLLGIGSFDGTCRRLEFDVLSITRKETRL